MTQPFDFLIILDFEATCEKNISKYPNEIIEFPMVLINTKTLEVLKIFREYVRPTLNPILTSFCTELTGIEQTTVDSSDTFNIVFERVILWVEEIIKEYQITDYNRFTFVTCGDWDLNKMLPAQCQLYKRQYNCDIIIPPYFKKWINIKVLFKEYFIINSSYRKKSSGESCGMVKMLSDLHLELVGKHHSGLDDSLNIGEIAKELLKRGQRFYVTRSYD